MAKENILLFYYCRTGVHCGSGSSLEVIDLPIQREKHTNFPIFQASSVKGTMRRFYNGLDLESIFGSESGNEYASCISFTDARVLFFPVKSFKEVFVWITCPLVLKKFQNDINIIGFNWESNIPDIFNDTSALIFGSAEKLSLNNKLIIDEYVFDIVQNQNQNLFDSLNLPHKEFLLSKLIVISNDMFKFFVSSATDVIARTAIDKERGVVIPGALWYEEYLPSDTFLYSLVLAENSRSNENIKSKNVIENLQHNINKIIQIGGNETIGKGIVELFWEKAGE